MRWDSNPRPSAWETSRPQRCAPNTGGPSETCSVIGPNLDFGFLSYQLRPPVRGAASRNEKWTWHGSARGALPPPPPPGVPGACGEGGLQRPPCAETGVVGVEGDNYAFGVGSAGQGMPTLHPKARRESCDRTPMLDRLLHCPPPPASRKIPIMSWQSSPPGIQQQKERAFGGAATKALSEVEM